jgi:hypothetical protein
MKFRSYSLIASILLALLTYTGAASASTSTSAPADDLFEITGEGPNPISAQDFTWDTINPGVASCPPQKFCMWTGLNYTGAGVAIGGVWTPCTGINFQKTPWENHAYSIKNNATGGVSMWNRLPVSGEVYEWLYDLVPGAYSGDFPAGRQADMMLYDPSYTC